MKALVMTKPGELVFEDRPKPSPKDGEVLFKILHVGICGSDISAFKGKQPFFSYPRVVGHELVVQAAEIPASSVTPALNYKEGDILSILPYISCGKCIACRKGRTNCCTSLKVLGVHVDGGLQEYISLPAQYGVAAAGLNALDIALVECFAIGFHSVRRANPVEGEAALVVGTGPIGIGVIHGLKERGLKVIAMDINDKRLNYAKDTAKADFVINSKESDPEKALSDITGGEGASLVVDATGNAGQMMKAFDYASAAATVVYAGLVRDEICFSDPLLHAKEISLLTSRNATKEDFENVIAGIKSGRLNTQGFVTHRATLDETPSNFVSWTMPETGCIKAVVELP